MFRETRLLNITLLKARNLKKCLVIYLPYHYNELFRSLWISYHHCVDWNIVFFYRFLFLLVFFTDVFMFSIFRRKQWYGFHLWILSWSMFCFFGLIWKQNKNNLLTMYFEKNEKTKGKNMLIICWLNILIK